MNKMIRRSLQILVLLVLLAAPIAPVLAADTVVSLSPASGSLNVGDTLVVDVMVSNVTALFGAEFHLTFDAGKLEVVDADGGTDGVQITMGSFLSADFIAQNVADNGTGKVDFGVSQMSPHGPVSGTGVLAKITFKAKAAGTANLAFTNVLLADASGTQISATSQNGTLTVAGDATPVPTTTTTTPTTTATATTTPAPSCTAQGYHVVRAGETLYSIGRAYATLPSKIASCNGILNASRIYVGMKLLIPIAPWSPIPAGPVAVRQFTPGGTVTPAPVTPTPTPACRYYHTVRYGDTLTAIAIRYGSSVWAIGRANSIYNLNLIYAGQVLCIP
jgi:LysM repeat protein